MFTLVVPPALKFGLIIILSCSITLIRTFYFLSNNSGKMHWDTCCVLTMIFSHV